MESREQMCRFFETLFGDLECVYLAWHVVSRFLIPNKWVVISLGVLYNIWRNNSRPGLTWNLRCFLLNEAHQQINMLGLANTKDSRYNIYCIA